MIEILPNWHPVFVHFTVALFSISVVLYLLSYVFRYLRFVPLSITNELEIVGRWSLWLAAFVTIFTVAAGLYAYNTVRHDAVTHAAMTNHRNWALPTAAAILMVAIWSGWRHSRRKMIPVTFIVALLIVQVLLLATAWRGAELVYRYGLGVMSMPQIEMEGDHHHHEMMNNSSDSSAMPVMENHTDHKATE